MIIKKNRLRKISDTREVANSFSVGQATDEKSVAPDFEMQNFGTQNFAPQPTSEIYDEDAVEESSGASNVVQPEPMSDIDLFNLDNIDFSQRIERRQGNRRRGFRRSDDRNLVSRAKEEADSIREAARNEGYRQGLADAQNDLLEFKAALTDFMTAKQEVFEYIAPDILEISVDIAKKIIKKEVEQDPQILFDTIVDVLKTLSREEAKINIRVSPAQLNVVKESLPKLVDISGVEATVTVFADDEIQEGGCIVTTNNGIVDATIQSEIAVVVEALKEL